VICFGHSKMLEIETATALLAVDTTAEAIRQADAGNSDAIKYLLNQVADHLTHKGQIRDHRVASWFLARLETEIENLPGNDGRPDELEAYLEWALKVETRRRQLKAEGIKAPKEKAIEQVTHELNNKSVETVKRKIQPYLAWAIEQVDERQRMAADSKAAWEAEQKKGLKPD
jgi:hypothetical protein